MQWQKITQLGKLRFAPNTRNAVSESFYRQSGAAYRNPHEPELRRVLDVVVAEWKLDLSHVLDLAAGSGEVTIALREMGAAKIEGIDPYTYEAYEARTGLKAGRGTFADIAAGARWPDEITALSFAVLQCTLSKSRGWRAWRIS